MLKTASDISADFVMAVGDNFYLSGIRSDEFSSRFHDTFENVYEGQSLQVPWLICAGNHDYLGNVTAQIAYSSHSSRWTFPALYYSKSFASEDGVTVDVLMIDTVSLTGAEDSLVEDENDPEYFRPLKEVPRSQDEDQWNWLEATLASSTADYVFVGGHFPVRLSSCLRFLLTRNVGVFSLQAWSDRYPINKFESTAG
jgi:tartrate-resistant acid phosphatase type 5